MMTHPLRVMSTWALRALLTVASLAALLALAGCRQSPAMAETAPADGAQAAYHKITAKDAKEMLDADTDKLIKLVDVRTEEEFVEKHIPGATLLPVADVEKRAAEVLPDKAQKLLIYCRSGHRSRIAAQALVKLGYTNVYDFGGLNDWPYETVAGK